MHTLYMMKNNYLLKSNLKRKKFVKPMKMCTKPNSIVVAEVINIKTWVNVLWQVCILYSPKSLSSILSNILYTTVLYSVQFSIIACTQLTTNTNY